MKLKEKCCKPELVEGGLSIINRVRQAHPDNFIYVSFY